MSTLLMFPAITSRSRDSVMSAAVFERFRRHDWAQDVNFLMGLANIQQKWAPEGLSPAQLKERVQQVQAFYFDKCACLITSLLSDTATGTSSGSTMPPFSRTKQSAKRTFYSSAFSRTTLRAMRGTSRWSAISCRSCAMAGSTPPTRSTRRSPSSSAPTFPSASLFFGVHGRSLL